MAAPVFTIKVKAGRNLMERIQEICKYLEVSPANFIEYAIDNELHSQEVHKVQDDIAIEEIRQNILGSGQVLTFAPEEEDADYDVCELCMKHFPKGKEVEGPLLCDQCLSLAKGGDMDTPRPRP